jgi:hypothetical protein
LVLTKDPRKIEIDAIWSLPMGAARLVGVRWLWQGSWSGKGQRGGVAHHSSVRGRSWCRSGAGEHARRRTMAVAAAVLIPARRTTRLSNARPLEL